MHSMTRWLTGRVTRRPSASPCRTLELGRAATYPTRHPRAWYHLADTRELRRGEAVHVEALGRCFTLSRAADGSLSCTVDADTSVPVVEQAGLVMAWFDGAGGPPDYPPTLVPEADDGSLVHHGRYAPRTLQMHLWEFAENSVDMAHFAEIHEALTVPWTQVEVPGMGLHHTADWVPDDDHPWVARFHDTATLVRGTTPIPESTSTAEATFVGPGSLVVFRLDVPQIGKVCIVQTHTPLQAEGEPLRLRVRFSWFAEPHVWRLMSFYVVGNWVSQWWRDVDLWENKVHLPKPVLCPGDGPVHRFRRWYRQFYPSHSRSPHAHAV